MGVKSPLRMYSEESILQERTDDKSEGQVSELGRRARGEDSHEQEHHRLQNKTRTTSSISERSHIQQNGSEDRCDSLQAP